MAADPSVIRSRGIRERILRLLAAQYAGNPAAGVPHGQIVEGFSTGRVSYGSHEIQCELLDLHDSDLVRILPGDGDPEKTYQITKNGRDFCRAKFPWGRIDEYTGSAGLMGREE
jgi:hypothetical protein